MKKHISLVMTIASLSAAWVAAGAPLRSIIAFGESLLF